MIRTLKSVLPLLFASFSLICSAVPDEGLDKALTLYESGLYSDALSLLQALPGYGDDAVIDGYAALCARKLHADGYEKLTDNYLRAYPSGELGRELRLDKAYELFSKGDYAAALNEFIEIPAEKIGDKRLAEYSFKKGYCHYKTGDEASALYEFSNVSHMPVCDYSAPAWYCIGYIRYCNAEFENAQSWFTMAAADERFAPIAEYYCVLCLYERNEYEAVIERGTKLYDGNVPEDRKAHLARLISESYLIRGDKEQARNYFENANDGSQKSRADYFYAGSLMFATGDWKAAVDNYSQMPEKTDSLGQIAWYNSALSYINMKNKVSALGSFKEASALDYDHVMTEDAMFNYAKLAFDLNGDTSVFSEYMKRFSDTVRGEKIYSYMALTALSNKDYQAAIDSYDKIESLEGENRRNYVKANYLRGAELLGGGSYRKAAQCLAAVSYYSEKNETVSQLAAFALAEAKYRDAQYADAAAKFTELYNTSALYGQPQGDAVPYCIAYAYLKNGEYDKSIHWFDVYCAETNPKYMRDAMLRKADCLMAQKKYAEAAVAYQTVWEKKNDVNDIYPYYRSALAYGLIKATGKKAKTNKAKKIELLDKVMSADPTSPYYADAMFELGKTYLESKQTSKAKQCFLKTAESNPASTYAAKAYLELGTAYRSEGNTASALSYYERVVEQMPSTDFCDDALMAIESIYQSVNQPDRYFAYLDKIGRGATKSDDERCQMSFAAAEQLYFSGDYRAASESFKTFAKDWPSSEEATASVWYIGECYRNSGDKVLACDSYKAVIDKGRGAYYEKALRQYADLSYSLEDYVSAETAYDSLCAAASNSASLSLARTGKMRSAFMAKHYQEAERAASVVVDDPNAIASEAVEARMIKARSLLAMSRREDAFKCFEELSAYPKTKEGAEATYLIIQDLFDKGDFQAVQDKVYAFSDSGTSQQFWLAKAFIVLGDAFAEQGKLKQAKATFQSIADGYDSSEEINSEVKVRLDKLNSLNL